MADNYLENQYEQYRARKAAWEKAKNPVRHKRYISRHFPSKKVERKCSLPEVQGYWQSHCRSFLQA